MGCLSDCLCIFIKRDPKSILLVAIYCKGPVCFCFPTQFAKVLFPPGGDTDHDFSNSIKGKLHLSRSMFCTV